MAEFIINVKTNPKESQIRRQSSGVTDAVREDVSERGKRLVLRWEFIKENKKVRKQELDQESDQEKKKTRTRPRKRSRKQELDIESDQEKRKLSFFLDHFLVQFFFLVFLLCCLF